MDLPENDRVSNVYELAYRLRTLEQECRVMGRKLLSDGTFQPYTAYRLMKAIDFPQNKDEEFVVSEHKLDLGAPLCRYYANFGSLPDPLVQYLVSLMTKAPFLGRHTYLAPIPSGGLPFAEAISMLTGQKILNIFRKVGEGLKRRVVIPDEVPLGDPGMEIIIVEDVIRKGINTRDEAMNAAIKKRYHVGGVLAALDRKEGGREWIERSGVPFFAGVNIIQIWEALLSFNDPNLLTPEQFAWVNSNHRSL